MNMKKKIIISLLLTSICIALISMFFFTKYAYKSVQKRTIVIDSCEYEFYESTNDFLYLKHKYDCKNVKHH